MSTKEKLTDLFIREYPYISSTDDLTEVNFKETGIDWLELTMLIESIEEEFSIIINYVEEEKVETFGQLLELVEEKVNG